MAEPKLERTLKTLLTRKWMSPQWLLEAAGTISVKTLNAMEKAIEGGCVKLHATCFKLTSARDSMSRPCRTLTTNLCRSMMN